jgi:hypothetical protein
LADLVEKGLDVAIKHPVDAPPTDPERECIQRLTGRMLSPVRLLLGPMSASGHARRFKRGVGMTASPQIVLQNSSLRCESATIESD